MDHQHLERAILLQSFASGEIEAPAVEAAVEEVA